MATSDTQLWYLSETERSVPLYCVPGRSGDQNCWYVAPALTLTSEQFAWTKQKLDDLAFYVGQSVWFVRHELLTANLTKANGITPKHYLRWDSAAPAEVMPQPEKPGDRGHDFVLFTCRAKGLANVAVAQHHWWAFCESAIDWMIDERRPLDLGWAKVHAMPYRANWMHMLASRFPGLGRILNLPDDQREATLAAMDIDGHLLSANLVQFDPKTQTFGWTLHVEQAEPWVSYTVGYEESAVLEHTPETYASRWAILARRFRRSAIDLLRAFFKAVAIPNAVVDQRAPEGQRRLIAATQGRIRATAPPMPVARGVYPTAELANAPTENPSDDAPPEGMQEVPDAEFGLELLRRGGRNN